jgi:hypothetical protein
MEGGALAGTVLGERPRTGAVDVYFTTIAITNVALWLAMPARWRSVAPIGVLAVQASTISGNMATTRGLCGF